MDKFEEVWLKSQVQIGKSWRVKDTTLVGDNKNSSWWEEKVRDRCRGKSSFMQSYVGQS